jgi:hypothetical protein
MDCPNLETCPFPEIKSNVSDQLWKMLYCYEAAMYGFRDCSRYKHKETYGEAPPMDILPNS